MKARIVTQHDANPLTTDPKYAELLVPVTRMNRNKPQIVWTWPVGLIVEDQKAIELVEFGLAEPIDDECATACGMNPIQVAAAILAQEMAQKGVHSKEDQELYRAGVIKGFKPKDGGGVEYDW